MKSAEKVRLTGGRVEKETPPGKCAEQCEDICVGVCVCVCMRKL